MDANKQFQEVSLIGRFLSMEALLMVMGVASLLYGIMKGSLAHVFWGLIIIPGVLMLVKVRRDRRLKRHNQR